MNIKIPESSNLYEYLLDILGGFLVGFATLLNFYFLFSLFQKVPFLVTLGDLFKITQELSLLQLILLLLISYLIGFVVEAVGRNLLILVVFLPLLPLSILYPKSSVLMKIPETQKTYFGGKISKFFDLEKNEGSFNLFVSAYIKRKQLQKTDFFSVELTLWEGLAVNSLVLGFSALILLEGLLLKVLIFLILLAISVFCLAIALWRYHLIDSYKAALLYGYIMDIKKGVR